MDDLGCVAGISAIAGILIETANLNDIDPHAWLADTLARITDYKINRIDDLLGVVCGRVWNPTLRPIRLALGSFTPWVRPPCRTTDAEAARIAPAPRR